MSINFLRPELLNWLYLVLPLVLGLCLLNFWQRRRARAAYGEEKLVGRFTRPLTLLAEGTIAAAWGLIATLLVVAAAGPVSDSLPTQVRAGTLEVVSVVDISRSMGAEDYRRVMPPKDGIDAESVIGSYGNRLDYVKLLLMEQLMPAITGNKLGVVTYTGKGFEQVPLTDDWSAARWVMNEWMNVGNAPGTGSDYAEGLDMALKMFDRAHEEGKEKIILLFTDGGFTGNEEHLAEVLAKVTEADVRMIIVGVGSRTPSPIPVYNEKGHYVEDFKIGDGVALTAVDEGALQALAARAGAEYMLLDPNSDGSLDVSWAGALGGTKTETNEDPVFQYPLGAALLLMFGLFLRGLWRRSSLTL